MRCILIGISVSCAFPTAARAQDPSVYWMLSQADRFERAAKTPLTPLEMQLYYMQQARALRWNAGYLASMQTAYHMQSDYHPTNLRNEPNLRNAPSDAAPPRLKEERQPEATPAEQEREKRHEAELARAKAEADARAAREKLEIERERRLEADARARKAEAVAAQEREKQNEARIKALQAEADRERAERERDKRQHEAEMIALKADMSREKNASAVRPPTGEPLLDWFSGLHMAVQLVLLLFLLVLTLTVVTAAAGGAYLKICMPLVKYWLKKP
jgi:hypothetical protein